MTEKIRKMISLILAVMVLMLVFVSSFAEESDEFDTDAFVAFDEDTDESDDSMDDDLIDLDDDYCGFVDPEVIAEHTPEMTQDFIFADDSNSIPETDDETAETIVAEDVANEHEQTNEAEAQDEADPEMTGTESENSVIAEPEEGEVAEVMDAEVTEEKTEGEPEAEDVYEDTGVEEGEPQEISVTVEATMIGENEMKLNAFVNGPEGYAFAFQWQISEDGGEHYRDIEEATNDELQVELSDSNINSLWRVKVNAI